MKKLLTLLLILTACSLHVQAQRQFQKPLRSETIANPMSRSYFFGMHVGCPLSILTKSSLHDNYYDGRWGTLVGLSGERFFRNASVGLEVSWAQRGTKMHRESSYQISFQDNGTRHLEISAAYDVVALRVPFTYYMQRLDKKAIPYLFVAPEVDFPLPIALLPSADSWLPSIGTPTMTTTELFIQHGDTIRQSGSSEISPRINVSAVAGAGMLFQLHTSGGSTLLLKFDVGMNVGLLNQATDADKEQDIVIRSHSLEARASLLFQFKKPLRDACHNFDRR